jgi:DNA-binding transcriptional LysR family regulator
MDRWQAMRIFVKVAEAGGFAEASRQLGLSPPAVTRAIAALEKTIGAPLLVRTTRSVKLTESGVRYLEDCQRILLEISDAEAAAAGSYSRPTGTLTVTAPVLFGQMHVQPIVTRFLRTHPDVTARTIYLDRNVNLIEEGVDVAVRIGELADSEMHAVGVGSVRRVVCASPDYLKRYGEPLRPRDLANHQVIVPSGASTLLEWRFGRDRKTAVTVRPRLNCNLNEAAIAAALDGFGVTRVLSYQVGDHLRSGRLKELLKEFEVAPMPVHVVRTGGRTPSAKVRAFVDMAVAELKSNEILQ